MNCFGSAGLGQRFNSEILAHTLPPGSVKKENIARLTMVKVKEPQRPPTKRAKALTPEINLHALNCIAYKYMHGKLELASKEMLS